ncbi:hypothetical protein fugu_014206 [Takifugu bimaculatus]|uniref:Claudin n=1 Tax=Takifugu bimaculatus TaxID=433685 RepID=A0A4Z2C2P3_9TELE|nr:hypothetical protein fugu_014206 [Takifugu bimaculatus]
MANAGIQLLGFSLAFLGLIGTIASTIMGTRGLMLASVLLSVICLLVEMVGMRCTTFMAEEPEQKDKVALGWRGLLALVGTSWYGHRIAKEFYDPFTPTNSRYEFGSALYVGWGAACLTLIGGGFLCCSCPKKGSQKSPRYPPTRSSGPQGKDYV